MFRIPTENKNKNFKNTSQGFYFQKTNFQLQRLETYYYQHMRTQGVLLPQAPRRTPGEHVSDSQTDKSRWHQAAGPQCCWPGALLAGTAVCPHQTPSHWQHKSIETSANPQVLVRQGDQLVFSNTRKCCNWLVMPTKASPLPRILEVHLCHQRMK